jgi:hypothetical protein
MLVSGNKRTEMVNESKYLKEEILCWAQDLDAKRSQRNWNTRTNARIERFVFLGFYTVRKLIESRKLSSRVSKQTVAVSSFPRGMIAAGAINAPLLRVHYDLSRCEQRDLALRTLCDQIVHSYVFSIAVTTGTGLRGFYFASDYAKDKTLYFLSVDVAVALLRDVASDRLGEFDRSVIEHFDDFSVWTAFPPPYVL